MAYQLSWYVDKRVLLGSFDGVVTPNDLIEVNSAATEMVRQGNPPVHDIIDALALERVPFDLKLLNRSIQMFKEPNLGWVVVIARNPLFGFFGTILSQAAGKHVRVVSTWDEALQTLIRADASLSDLILSTSSG
ncbi:MAG: hypothetical protein K8I30_20880 [Anaerolineae bacterium]|nr:hypothetical protein [Anaerolineae bacterium]